MTRPPTRLALFALALVAGCWADKDPPVAKVGSCSSADWREIVRMTVLPLPQTPDRIKVAQGRLFWSALPLSGPSFGPAAILSVPLAGGEPTVHVRELTTTHFWVDGDRILYTVSDVLKSVPLAGGPAVTVLEGGTTGMRPDGLTYGVGAQEIDGAHFYWEVTAYERVLMIKDATLWRMPLAGGPAERLAQIADASAGRMAYAASSFIFSGDSILVGVEGGSAFQVPKAGGPPVQFASMAGAFVAADEAGVVWREPALVSPTIRFSVVRTTPRGARPESFWTDKPFELEPTWGWSDGRGGYVIRARERFAEDTTHDALWRVDSSGRGTRIACLANDKTNFMEISAVAPDGIYLATETYDPPSWTIGKLTF